MRPSELPWYLKVAVVVVFALIMWGVTTAARAFFTSLSNEWLFPIVAAIAGLIVGALIGEKATLRAVEKEIRAGIAAEDPGRPHDTFR